MKKVVAVVVGPPPPPRIFDVDRLNERCVKVVGYRGPAWHALFGDARLRAA